MVCPPTRGTHLHFTPTHASWLNLIERWFGLLTERQIRRGSHDSVWQLKNAIQEFLAASNEQSQAIRLDEVGRTLSWQHRTICYGHDEAHGV